MTAPFARADLGRALSGIRALVLDADGVLVARGAAIAGAADALATLDAHGVPWRVATNYSSRHRETLAARFAEEGVVIPPQRMVTALSATVEDARRRYAGRPVFVLTHPDGLREFDGVPRISPEEADAEGATAAAVIMGDAFHDLSFENLDRAFRLVRRGAELVAMHRNGWWYTAKGETIDTGAFVAAIEYATGVRARLTGKPGPLMFRAAHRSLAAEVAAAGGPPLRRSEVAMVGDHAPQDVAGAHRAGLRGILVLTGRTTAGEVPELRGPAVPDGVAPSVAEVVAALA